MGSINDSIVNDVGNLSQDDLVDVYDKLARSYCLLKAEIDKCKQEIHQERAKNKILLSIQNDLQNELEGINGSHQKELQAIIEKNCSTVELLKQKNHELETDRIRLETDIDEINIKLQDCKAEIEELKTKLAKPAQRISDSFNRNLERESETLQLMVKEIRVNLEASEAEISEKRAKIEELTEKVLCLEDNSESRKSEIEEKNDQIESLQYKIIEMTDELAMLKDAPEDNNRKGNSLFGEIDDQRQRMKLILKSERAHYLEMKKSFNAKEMEIRRLRRENMNIKNEIQACSNLLMRGEQIAIQTLSAHVFQLQNDNKKLEKQLASAETNLMDLAKKNPSLGWIESLLSTASNDTREVKDKRYQLMLEKSSLAENLNKNQRELAKARLDCVKFKILLSRIVDENNLCLCADDFFDIGIDEEVFEGLKVEKFESLDHHIEQSSNLSFSQIEEVSTYSGGRERDIVSLSASVPVKICGDPEGKYIIENKENVKATIEVQQFPASVKPSDYPDIKPSIDELQQAVKKSPASVKLLEAPKIDYTNRKSLIKVEKEDTVKLPLETKAVEQPKPFRNRQVLNVKRILIPSKSAAADKSS